MKLKPGFNLVMVTGLVIGILAVAAEAYFKVQPPSAYGICLLGHPRDLTTWVANNVFGANWVSTEAFVVFPAFTVIGVLIGSFIAANRNKELRLRPGPVRNKFFAFMFGFLVVNFGLLWGSCPIRTTVLASYGNFIAVIVLASIIVGVIIASIYVRLRARKDTRL